MEAKLIKVENTFYLKQDGTILGTSSYPNLSASIRYSLSLKNCEVIANGYDVYELAKENYHKFWPIIDESGLINHTFGYVEGFQKALEVNADKRFTLEDMMNCWNKALTFKDHKELFGYHIQSLQQTEWDVEIEMENIIHLKNRRGGLTNMGKPKLDADECLILKRK